MMLRYGIDPGPFQLHQKDARPGPMKIVLLLGYAFMHVGWLVVITGFITVVQLATLVSILRDPSVAEWFSVLVFLYVVSASLGSFGMSKLFGIGSVKNKPPIYLPDLDDPAYLADVLKGKVQKD